VTAWSPGTGAVLADAGTGAVAGAGMTGADALAAGVEAGAVAGCCWHAAKAIVAKATQIDVDAFIVAFFAGRCASLGDGVLSNCWGGAACGLIMGTCNRRTRMRGGCVLRR